MSEVYYVSVDIRSQRLGGGGPMVHHGCDVSSMLLVGVADDVGRFGRWRGNQGAIGASHALFADV